MTQTRQIHLDFHCSEHIEAIGRDFSKTDFQDRLKSAKVNSINLFAKCHHSWSYYPTKLGKIHPNLQFDLLGEQLKACHEIGIKAPIYYTVGWSANDAERHPEWCARTESGDFISINGPSKRAADEPLPHYEWKFLCLNNPYHNQILSEVEELCTLYAEDIDGFWFDIYQVHRSCYCELCQKSMRELGIDMGDPQKVEAFTAQVMKRHCAELSALIKVKHPKASVFFNGTTAIEEGANFRYGMYAYNTVQDLEDLPTAWGGYDKFPMQSKYFLKAGDTITAMSGKFHTAWGEFGGFKHPNALKYEASSMIAFGANCNFGDQLHPNGQLDASTYQNIGYAYDYVEKIEAYGIGGQPIARLGLWRSFDEGCDEGMAKILMEAQVDFEIANSSEYLKEFEVLIIPSRAKLSEDDVSRLKLYLAEGGKLISLSKGLLDHENKVFKVDLGLEYLGTASFDCDYTLAEPALLIDYAQGPFLNNLPAIKTKPKAEAETLAHIHEPYFSRTPSHYCSHQNTPYKIEQSSHPAVVRHKSTLFLAHDLDVLYFKGGARVHRDLFINALNLIYKAPLVKVNLPSTGRISLLHQERQQRYVLHLLFSTPIQRGDTSVIEDLVALHDVKVDFCFNQEIKRVRLIPDDKELEAADLEGNLSVTIPRFECHCALVFDYST